MRKTEDSLDVVVFDTFIDIEVNSRSTSKLKYSALESSYLELDLWIPHLNICFEFQVQHLLVYFHLYFQSLPVLLFLYLYVHN